MVLAYCDTNAVHKNVCGKPSINYLIESGRSAVLAAGVPTEGVVNEAKDHKKSAYACSSKQLPGALGCHNDVIFITTEADVL